MTYKNSKIQPVILCGGSGTRLWPLSRSGFPKQFLCLTGEKSLFQQAVERMLALGSEAIKLENPIIVTGDEHRFLALEQMKEINVKLGTALLEPVPRNTAPALTLAALTAVEGNDDPILVVTPADHSILNINKFNTAIIQAINCAIDGAIVVLGIAPDKPETGFGYMKVKSKNEKSTFNVEKFVEKPSLAVAEKYFRKGGYYWNAGIFIMKASVWINALCTFRPDIYDAVKLALDSQEKDNSLETTFIRPDAFKFNKIPNESIDYAVMEHCCESLFSLKMIELKGGWSDLGSWDAVWDFLPKDKNNNTFYGDVISEESTNNLVYSSNRLVTLVGVNNLSVIETSDAILISNKKNDQGIKKIVKKLEITNREENSLHRKVYRPWGWYDSIDEGDRFKVKRILVNPGATLSLQKHKYRAEHWIVVKGVAEIIKGNKKIILKENESTYIPQGETHRLTNSQKKPLEIVEVQSGDYLGEDDIIRFEDKYGRLKK